MSPKALVICSPAGNSLDYAACTVPAGWVTHVALHRDPVWGSSKASTTIQALLVAVTFSVLLSGGIILTHVPREMHGRSESVWTV